MYTKIKARMVVVAVSVLFMASMKASNTVLTFAWPPAGKVQTDIVR